MSDPLPPDGDASLRARPTGADGDYGRPDPERRGTQHEAAAAVSPGASAAVLVYENTWAIPFITAARNVGAEVVASARIPADILMDALAAFEA